MGDAGGEVVDVSRLLSEIDDILRHHSDASLSNEYVAPSPVSNSNADLCCDAAVSGVSLVTRVERIRSSDETGAAVAHARGLLASAKWAEALCFARVTLQTRWPHIPDSYYVAGVACVKMRRYGDAVKELSACLELIGVAEPSSQFHGRSVVVEPALDRNDVRRILHVARRAYAYHTTKKVSSDLSTPITLFVKALSRFLLRCLTVRVPLWAALVTCLLLAVLLQDTSGVSYDD